MQCQRSSDSRAKTNPHDSSKEATMSRKKSRQRACRIYSYNQTRRKCKGVNSQIESRSLYATCLFWHIAAPTVARGGSQWCRSLCCRHFSQLRFKKNDVRVRKCEGVPPSFFQNTINYKLNSVSVWRELTPAETGSREFVELIQVMRNNN